MRQLSGMDTYWLGLEDSRTHGHMSCLAVLDPASAPNGEVTLEAIRSLIEERLHLIPPFRWRLAEVPFGIDYPYWFDDPDFDLDFHLRELALPVPGNLEQLTEQVSRLFSRHLDRTRPLWEIYLIHGLEGGRLALFTKVHHAAIDGVTGAEILGTLLDLEPDGCDVEPPQGDLPGERPPGQLHMFARGLAGSAIRPWRYLRAIPQLVPGAAQPLVGRLRRSERPDVDAPGPMQGPETPFGGRISPHRRMAFASLSLELIKETKNALGVTVNDVIVSVCAGGMRRWLLEQDGLPDAPLLAAIPVSTRKEGEASDYSNAVSVMIVPIPTDEADPKRRLEAAHQTLSAAKQRHAGTPASALQDAQHFIPPWTVARASAVVGAIASSPLRLFPNLNITNVPGPPIPLYCAGAQLVALYPIAPIFDTIPLNLAVMSYNGDVYCCVVGDRDKLPDAGRITELMSEELDELHAAVAALQP